MVDLHKELSFSDLIPKLPAKKPRPVSEASAKRRPMPPEVVGLKIEAGSLTAAHVLNNGGKKLLRVARAPLPQGVVGGGEVRDPAGLATALNEFFASHDLPRRGVRIGLANSRIGVRVIEITGVSDLAQLENAIGFRAHEILSVPLDEAVLDYHVLGTTVDEEGAVTYGILLVVAYRDSIDRYLAATDAAGLELCGIDLEAFALLRAAAEPPDSDDPDRPAIAVVSIDHDLTTLAISDGSVCRFARVLDWGTANVDAALVRALKVTPEQAVELRRALSATRGDGAPRAQAQEPAQAQTRAEAPAEAESRAPVARPEEGRPPLSSDRPSRQLEQVPPLGERQPQVPRTAAGAPPTRARVQELVDRELHALLRELQSSFRFYQSQPDARRIGEILVSGPLADLPDFAKVLGGRLGSPVEVADPFARVELEPDVVRPDRAGGLAVAVGLGIED
jgi:type IV pilus assembly protein PilM